MTVEINGAFRLQANTGATSVFTIFQTILFCNKKKYAGKVRNIIDNAGKTHKLSRDRQRRDYYSNKRQRMATITITIDTKDLKAPEAEFVL